MHRSRPAAATTTPALLALALAATLGACGSGDGSDDVSGDGSATDATDATATEQLVEVSDEVDAAPSWLAETTEPRGSASGLCTDPFAEGRDELTTTELAACQVEALQQVVGYVQTIDAGPDAATELRVSTEEGLAVDADLGVAQVIVVGDQWWASRDGEEWLEPAEARDVAALSGVDGAASSLQQLHDPSVAAASTQPFDVAVTGSALVDGTEVAVLTGAGEGPGGGDVAVTYYTTRDYVVLLSRTELTTSAGTASTVTVISELDVPQDVAAPM